MPLSLCLQIPYHLKGVRGTLSMGPEMGDLQIFKISTISHLKIHRKNP